MKIAVLGVGHMASAMIKGLINSGNIDPRDIYIKKGKTSNANILSKELGTNFIEKIEEIPNCDIILFATPSKYTLSKISEIKNIISSHNTIISVAGGISLTDIEKVVGDSIPVACLVPNVGVEVNKGVLAFTPNELVDRNNILTIFGNLGKIFQVHENQLDIFTTIAGCGPAFINLFVESMSDGATNNGMERKLSYEVIIEMMLGSAYLIKDSDKHVAMLKDTVTSPGGSTIKGVLALEKNNFRYSIIDAINSIGHN